MNIAVSHLCWHHFNKRWSEVTNGNTTLHSRSLSEKMVENVH